MEQGGFKVGERVDVQAGASITTDDGKQFIKTLEHSQRIVIDHFLDEDGDRPLLLCWKHEDGTWYEAEAKYCKPIKTRKAEKDSKP